MLVSKLVLVFIGILIAAVVTDIVVTLIVASKMSRENRLIASALAFNDAENETKNNIGEQDREEDAG